MLQILLPALLLAGAPALAPAPRQTTAAVEGAPAPEAAAVRDWLVVEPVDARGRRPVRPDVVFLRPKLSAFLGLRHTYDGSTQGLPRISGSDTFAVYLPLESHKNNYYLNGALDVGGGLLKDAWGAALWSGIDLRLWSRHLDVGFKEYYYWMNVPIGLLACVDVSPHARLGIESNITLFVGVYMHAVDSSGPGRNSSAPDYPAVHLGDSMSSQERIGFAVSLPMQFRVAPAMSLRLKPWFEFYHFEKSNVDSVMTYGGDMYSEPEYQWFYEPASKSYWWGLAIDFVIHRRRYQ